jgi:4-hydroxybenzoyl-CoA thioesterase
MPSFEFKHKVLFQHCDPAGMVFYPRYFEMINACIETWFDEELLSSFKRMHLELGLSVPTASTQTDFRAPSHLGDLLVFQLQVEKLGNTSLHLQINVTCDGQLRLTNDTTLVLIEQHNGCPSPWRKHPCFDSLTHTFS